MNCYELLTSMLLYFLINYFELVSGVKASRAFHNDRYLKNLHHFSDAWVPCTNKEALEKQT